jgi:hypothetical protein
MVREEAENTVGEEVFSLMTAPPAIYAPDASQVTGAGETRTNGSAEDSAAPRGREERL